MGKKLFFLFCAAFVVFSAIKVVQAKSAKVKVSKAKRLGASGLQTITDIRPAAGGITPADTNNPEIRKIAQFATERIAEQQNQVGNLQLVRIKRAQKQVVSGMKYYLTLELRYRKSQKSNQECNVVVWDQPWTNTRKITEMKCSGPGPGHIFPVDPNDPKVQEIAQFATDAIAEKQNQAGNLYLIRVIQAGKQVVAGTNFHLTLELGSVDNEDETQECKVVVFDQPWTNTRKITKQKCSQALSGPRVERADHPVETSVLGSEPVFGGVNPTDPNDPEVQKMAQFATQKIAEQQNQAGNLYLITVLKAGTQVVAGTNYYLTIVLGFLDSEDTDQVCEVVVFDQPWTQTRELSDVKCFASSTGLEIN